MPLISSRFLFNENYGQLHKMSFNITIDSKFTKYVALTLNYTCKWNTCLISLLKFSLNLFNTYDDIFFLNSKKYSLRVLNEPCQQIKFATPQSSLRHREIHYFTFFIKSEINFIIIITLRKFDVTHLWFYKMTCMM